MNILLDYSQIPKQKVGVGVYAENLLKNICKYDKKNKYFVLIQNDEALEGVPHFESMTFIRLPNKIFRIFAFRLLMEQFYIPFLVLRKNINLVHSLHYSFPLFTFKAKKVVTIHDLTFFLYPELHEPFKRFYFRFFIRLSVYLCDKIICVSESTKKDLVSRFSRSSNKIEVIPLGNDNRFCVNLDRNEIVRVKKKHNISNEYILFIGTLEPRKNIINLIHAFYKIHKIEKKYQLVIVGKKGWYFQSIFDLVTKYNLSDSIIFTGFIDEEEKPFIISGAKIFVYPSIYEGFGIPVLESIACGVPTITSNISSLPEVVGDAALLIDPLDETSIFQAINELLNNTALRNDLITKSLTQAKKFSWENTTLKTINRYLTV
jgi:glycosyltransferase involved in cell wall biosynthesis